MHILISLLLLLSGCGIDLDGLQTATCGPKHIACQKNQDCINNVCTNKPIVQIPDMSSPPDLMPPTFKTQLECITYYFPWYSEQMYFPTGFYSKAVPKVECLSCTETDQSQCTGRIAKQYDCTSMSPIIKNFTIQSQVNPAVTLLVQVNVSSDGVFIRKVSGPGVDCQLDSYYCTMSAFKTVWCDGLR